jgi:hypothetical protein
MLILPAIDENRWDEQTDENNLLDERTSVYLLGSTCTSYCTADI